MPTSAKDDIWSATILNKILITIIKKDMIKFILQIYIQVSSLLLTFTTSIQLWVYGLSKFSSDRLKLFFSML